MKAKSPIELAKIYDFQFHLYPKHSKGKKSFSKCISCSGPFVNLSPCTSEYKSDLMVCSVKNV